MIRARREEAGEQKEGRHFYARVKSEYVLWKRSGALKMVYVIRLSRSSPEKASGFYRQVSPLERSRPFSNAHFHFAANRICSRSGIKLITRLSRIPRSDYTFRGRIINIASELFNRSFINHGNCNAVNLI